MADSITPIRINQVLSKKPGQPIAASDWDDILNLLITQNNALSDQLQTLQTSITTTATNIINNLIASGTLSLNVDAAKLGGQVASAYATQANLTTLTTAIANTYATITALNTLKTTVDSLQSKITYSATVPTDFVGEGKVVLVEEADS
jgi:hypothetical protein